MVISGSAAGEALNAEGGDDEEPHDSDRDARRDPARSRPHPGTELIVVSELPSGTVTFLLTDVEGNTRLWQEHPDSMASVIERHDELIETAVSRRHGVLIKAKGEGDSTFSVFGRPTDGLAAAADVQRALVSEEWPEGIEVRVRAALHTGEAELRDGDYFGTTVNRAARLRSIAHGGQIICSQATADIVSSLLPEDISLRGLGSHRLRDIRGSEQVFQVCAEGLPIEFPPLQSMDAYRTNLPFQHTSFVGRGRELVAIGERIRDRHLVTLTGIGGCGKTRLALEVAARCLEDFPHGVFFCDLAPVSESEGVASTMAGALGLSGGPFGDSGRSVREDLLDTLAERELLVVLDNCEHLIEACAELADEILSRCPRVHILATSREALGVDGEATIPVPSLKSSSEEGEAEAIRLFRERAADVRDDFGLTADDHPQVVEICRRLDGIPLAIELAAAQVAFLSPRQIAERLSDRFRLLTGGRRKVQRQQTLAAALDWSHDLLTSDEQILLRRVAVLPGSFTLEAAEKICAGTLADQVVSLLRSLVTKSLVMTSESEDGGDLRYRLLETVRLYAEEKLVAAGEAEELRTRHRDHYLAWIESLPSEELLDRGGGRVGQDAHNLRGAMLWSEQLGEAASVARIASAMAGFWTADDVHEGQRFISKGWPGISELEEVSRLRFLAARAQMSILVFDPEALEHAREAAAMAERHRGTWASLANACAFLMLGFQSAGSTREVEEFGRRALDSAGGPASRALALWYLGTIHIWWDELERAIELLEEAMAIRGDVALRSGVIADILLAYQLTGRDSKAFEIWEEVRTVREDADPSTALWVASAFALTLAANGRRQEALNLLEDRTRVAPSLPGVMGGAVIILAGIATIAEDWERASTLLAMVPAHQQRGVLMFRSAGFIAVYRHCLEKVRTALDDEAKRRCRKRGGEMSLEEALDYGLDRRYP